jgi:hypothetical protein
VLLLLLLAASALFTNTLYMYKSRCTLLLPSLPPSCVDSLFMGRLVCILALLGGGGGGGDGVKQTLGPT